MRTRQATGWLAIVVALSGLALMVGASVAQDTALPVVGTAVAALPVVVAVVAGVVLVGGVRPWVSAAATYLAVLGAIDAARLPAQVHTLLVYSATPAVWGATVLGLAGLVLAVMAVAVVRAGRDEGAGWAPGGAVRWVGLGCGVALAVATLLPWWGQTTSEGVVLTRGFEHWPLALHVASALGALVVLAVAVLSGAVRHRGVWIGAIAGLLGARPLVVGALADPSRTAAGVGPQPAAWIALAAQLGLAVVLAAVLVPRPRSHELRT